MMSSAGEVPTRRLGKTNVQVSILGLGGSHIGYKTLPDDGAVSLVREAIDGGITFMDNSWGYHQGRSEERMGMALQNGYRDKVFLMTKTEARDKAGALKQLDESLSRLKTDHLDLWQIHEVIYYNDPDWLRASGGALEALDEAKRSGKVRFVGFTGHKDPQIFLRMFSMYDFDTVQMPLNVMDAHFRSFEQQALPAALERDMGIIGIKPFGDHYILDRGLVTPREALNYSLSLPIATVVTGIDNGDVLRQDLDVVQHFACLTRQGADAIADKTRAVAGDGRYELYKTSTRFDGNEGREQHGFPSMEELAEEEIEFAHL
jgi:uncharacterized protein